VQPSAPAQQALLAAAGKQLPLVAGGQASQLLFSLTAMECQPPPAWMAAWEAAALARMHELTGSQHASVLRR
jgi:hypothetical protein